MIIFKKLRWRNFLSTGQHWTEIDLYRHKSTLVIGENGAGKSTMLDALAFALYGKPFRNINKPQLLNSVNKKNLEVELEFVIGTFNYKIIRGLKPNVFEIYRNDELLNQDAAVRDYQVFLEQNILKMNFKSFGQIVVLGSATFTPFMQLPAAHRREVIEDLLDIQVFSTMSNLLKEKVAANKTDLIGAQYESEMTSKMLESSKEHNDELRRLKSIEVDRLKSKAKELMEFMDDEQTAIDAIEAIIQTCVDSTADRGEVRSKYDEVRSAINKADLMIKQLTKDLTFFEQNDDCPTCRQGIDHDFKHTTIQQSLSKIEQFSTGKEKADAKLVELQQRLDQIAEIDKEANQATLKAGEHRANIKMIRQQLIGIKNDLVNAEKEVEEVSTDRIKELSKQLQAIESRKAELTFERETLAVATNILKDGGIKTRIIRQYIPVINKLINKYLSSLEFYVDFNLDEQFNETIKSRFRDEFSYGSFSEGEKMRINLSILFAWRAVARLRNSVSTNLLIMDEVFDSSLDVSGTDEFLKIINELTIDSNVFIISHKGDQLIDKFEHTLNFIKEKGFSRLAA